MAHRVRRKVIRRPRDEEDVEEEVVKPARKVVEKEDAEDELDEVPEQIKKIAKDDEEDIPAIFRNPIVKKVVVPPPVARKIVPPAKKVVEKEREELPLEKPVKDFETKTVNDVVLDNLFVKVMEHLGMGQELVIFKVSGDKWTIKIPGATEESKHLKMPPSKREEFEAKGYMTKASKSVGKLSGKEYEQEVCSQEYLDFVEEWRSMDITEKRKLAKSLGCKWDKAADAKIENMSLSRAVQEAKEITKYKPKYKSGAARASVKG
jgi:hypothetical protein